MVQREQRLLSGVHPVPGGLLEQAHPGSVGVREQHAGVGVLGVPLGAAVQPHRRDGGAVAPVQDVHLPRDLAQIGVGGREIVHHELDLVLPARAQQEPAPLDPLLWDRELVRTLFDFEYVWEVYKPASQRRWGWYVCPLLQRDRLIGRVEARVDGKALVVSKLWLESDDADVGAIRVALARHAELCGVTKVKMPRRFGVSQ